jgi:AcrR family transcriptional regulator
VVLLRGTNTFSASERARILRAAADLTTEKGYAEISVADVVERAGVTAETFARMFGDDLDECMLAAISAMVGEIMSAIAGTYSVDRSEWDSGLMAMKAILELMAANPSLAHHGYIVTRQVAPPRVHEAYEAATTLLSAMIDRLRDERSELDPPATTARSALGGPEAVVRAEIMAGRIDQLPRLLPDFAYAATVGFLGQEDALRLASRGRELLRGSPWE